MLTTETKRKIDNARDILVGIIPDPKSQIEQITIALIYKFMNDMDSQSEELGGVCSFFADEYEKYKWKNIISHQLSGQEKLNLYKEAIEKMYINQNIPQLFRDIFKNAYLPYRNPETFNLFMKQINEFSYAHSEELGNAFEYLLSVMSSQGDAGQFRTPRHIIDFVVDVIKPDKNETILDPACGTAGFLISAYKYVVRKYKEETMSIKEQSELTNNYTGYDISPDMVRLSLVNLYLHLFPTPKIFEYDTLSNEERWNEKFDIILANPPFMTPKGGIKPHSKFSINANRSEVLFVDYISDHLNINGRAGIIVPEGIIFQSANAYKSLRKKLVDNSLWAVISLPAGVFNPYSGVKTSILLLDKSIAKKTNDILFIKIDNDGYDLGAQRRPIDKNDLSDALNEIENYKLTLNNAKEQDNSAVKEEFALNKVKTKVKSNSEVKEQIEKTESENYQVVSFKKENVVVVSKKKLSENDYNLSAERYKETIVKVNQKWETVELGEVLDYEQPTKYIVESVEYSDDYKIPVLTAGKSFILGYTNENNGIFDKNNLPVIIFDDFTTENKYVDFPFKVKSSAMKILINKKSISNIKYLYYIMRNIKFNSETHKRYWISEYAKIKIPLPPLDVQKEIVKEIEEYQKIIDGAKQIVENWKPQIKIKDDWEMKELGEVCEITSSKRIFQEEYVSEGVPFYRTKEIVELCQGKEISLELFISRERFNEIKSKYEIPKNGELLISAVGTIGYIWIIDDIKDFYFKDGNLLWIKNLKEVINNVFLKYTLENYVKSNINDISNGVAYNALTITQLKQILIPIPPLNIQQQIVDAIEEERKIVEANKRLIEIYEGKIKAKIDEIWGE